MRRLLRALAGVWLMWANAAIAQVETDLGDLLVGRPDAPVTVEAYLSLGDPKSADVYLTVLPALKATYLDTGRAKLLYREFPMADLDIGATLLSRCGGEAKRALLVDLLFRDQPRWARAGACLGDPLMYGAIAAQRGVFMAERRIDAAPAFVVQGRRVAGADMAALEQALAAVGR
jgi:protein-disulfide isomerase